MRIKHHRAERVALVIFGSWYSFDNRLQQLVNADARFSGAFDDFVGINTKHLMHFFGDFVDACMHQVNFIDDRNDLEIVIHGSVRVRHCLCFDPLKRVDEQQCSFATRQGTRDFVLKVNVAGSIDQVQFVNQAFV